MALSLFCVHSSGFLVLIADSNHSVSDHSDPDIAQVRSLQGTQNAARRLLDSMTAISGTVSEVSSAPAASLSRWAADQVAPAYWRPNADIVNCNNCSKR